MRAALVALLAIAALAGGVLGWGYWRAVTHGTLHVAFFAGRVALTPEQVHATVHGDADDPVWSEDERLLIRLADELHDSATISDDLWRALAAAFSVEQLLELIALVGFYHTVSFFANGLRLAPEKFAAAFPPPDA